MMSIAEQERRSVLSLARQWARKHGRIVETGSWAELATAGGELNKMLELQTFEATPVSSETDSG